MTNLGKMEIQAETILSIATIVDNMIEEKMDSHRKVENAIDKNMLRGYILGLRKIRKILYKNHEIMELTVEAMMRGEL